MSQNAKSSLLARLRQDGRKTPEEFRLMALNASSPSQLNVRSISEYYNVPDGKLKTYNDVFYHRGYKKMGKIDEGAFGVVSKAERIYDNLIVAVKEIDLRRKRPKRIEEMKRELFVLQRVDSKYVVKLIEHFIIGQMLVIIMEFCAGNNLTAYLKDFDIGEKEAQPLFKQMALCIKVLHRKGIAHRDVKLNNFLLDAKRKNIKVGDFGLSVVSYRANQGIILAKTYCGTEPYMAPEILKRSSNGHRCYNPIQADIWSLGVCLYAMLTRTFPFRVHSSQQELLRHMMGRKWRFPRGFKETFSEELRDLVYHMLDPEAERRINIIGVLAHPWVNQNQPIELSPEKGASTALSRH